MKILIVEDNKTIADGIKFSLEQEGYSVCIKDSYMQAKNELLNNIYNLIILDIILPDGNGMNLCKEIKNNFDIPVIFLTAKDNESDIIQGLNIGADDYIVKPFRIGELIARINNAIRKYKKNEDTIKIENIVINIDKKTLYKNDMEIILTSLEWRILNILLNEIGHVVSREKLLNMACDIRGNFINDNSLTVYIKRLREKIEDDIENPKIIKTVKGIGYKINNV